MTRLSTMRTAFIVYGPTIIRCRRRRTIFFSFVLSSGNDPTAVMGKKVKHNKHRISNMIETQLQYRKACLLDEEEREVRKEMEKRER